MIEIPGIAGRPEQAAFGGRQQPELRAGALAEDRQAGIEEPLGEGAGVVRDIVLEDAGAEGGAGAFDEVEVLEQERHAGERAIRQSLVDLPPCVVVVPDHDGVDRGIDFVGARDRFVEQFDALTCLLRTRSARPTPS